MEMRKDTVLELKELYDLVRELEEEKLSVHGRLVSCGGSGEGEGELLAW